MFEIIYSGLAINLFLLAFAASRLKESDHIDRAELLEEERLIIEQACLDPRRFEWLYKKYKVEIFRFIYQRVEDKDLAFDITSQVFLKAMLNIHKYQFRGFPFSSWLYRIAINELNLLFKKNSTLRVIKLETEHLKNLGEIKSGELTEFKKGLVEALSALPESELYMVEMRFFEDRSFKSIGEILGITENNAKVRLYRILDKLKKLMTGE